jgi:hypothetical protein
VGGNSGNSSENIFGEQRIDDGSGCQGLGKGLENSSLIHKIPSKVSSFFDIVEYIFTTLLFSSLICS